MTDCRFALNDGAYVLGSLAPADRAEFERHLPGCSSCRKAMASLAVIPGLLGRLDAATINPSVEAPPTLLPRALQAVAHRRRLERRRRRWYAVASAAAATVLAAVVGVSVYQASAPAAPQPGPAPVPILTAMLPVADRMPVSAEVGLVTVDAGTRIDMNCRYAAGYDGRWTVRLLVYPLDGGPAEQVGSWTAASDEKVTVQALTHFTADEIGRIELQRGDRTPLLTWTRV